MDNLKCTRTLVFLQTPKYEDDDSTYYSGNRLIKTIDSADPVLLENSLDFPAATATYDYDSDGRPHVVRANLPWGYLTADGRANAYIPDYLGNIRAVIDPDGTAIQTTDYYPYGLPMPTSTAPAANRYKYGAKEFETRNGLNFHDFEARMLFNDHTLFARPDDKAIDYPATNPYLYCASNPLRYVDPTGEAWRPILNEDTGLYESYQWVAPEDSYDKDGNLLEGLYEQAILFSNSGSKGSFNPKSKYNIGTSTATVYKADGTTEEYDACTYPSDTEKFATVQEGIYEAQTGKHHGSKSEYDALRLGDVGTTDFYENRIELGKQNPSKTDPITYAKGINIHKAGISNFTGITKSGRGVSEGCLLIDINSWSQFISNFYSPSQINNTISVIIKR